MAVSFEVRLKELYHRLQLQTPSTNAEDALRRISTTLDEVEDEFSGVAKKEPPPKVTQFDGRMYAPLGDRISRDEEGALVAQTRSHRIEISKGGAITIRYRRTGEVEFYQSGGSS